MGQCRRISWIVFLSACPPTLADSPTSKPIADLVAEAQARSDENNWALAGPLWRQIVEQNPTHGHYWSQLGLALFREKHYRQAIPAYTKAFELRAGYPANSAYKLACCHGLLGEEADAVRWLETALNRGFRSLHQAQTDADLKSLRDHPKYHELVMLVDTTKLSRDDGWRHDLKLAAHEIKRLHFNPYREVSREAFDAYVQKLHDDIPKLTDGQITIGLVKLGRMAGDGHTHLRPAGSVLMLPLQLFLFEEGVFVTAVAPEHGELAGACLLKIGTHTTAEVLKALDPLISRDNAMGVKAIAPMFMTVLPALHGLGLIPDADTATLTVRDAAGKERVVTLKGVPTSIGAPRATDTWVTARKAATLPDPLTLKNRKAAYWFEYLPEHKLVFFQFNAVRNDGDEAFEKFCGRLFKFIDDHDVARLVIDLRWNGGGNTFLNRPLVHGLIRSEKINQRGKLFVIIGRNTFSAAQNCTTDIEMHTQAIFVGEPSGASPNFIGESIPITLPYSKMAGTISDLYWQRSWPMDYRRWIAPQLYAPPTFALYRANRDPAFEAILAYKQLKK
jgi:tetratricopeptide (TPR) repeat protein